MLSKHRSKEVFIHSKNNQYMEFFDRISNVTKNFNFFPVNYGKPHKQEIIVLLLSKTEVAIETEITHLAYIDCCTAPLHARINTTTIIIVQVMPIVNRDYLKL